MRLDAPWRSMIYMPIQRILSLVSLVLWVILFTLMFGRREGRLVPDWLHAVSKSNFLWVTICVLGLLASALKLMLL